MSGCQTQSCSLLLLQQGQEIPVEFWKYLWQKGGGQDKLPEPKLDTLAFESQKS